MPGYLITGGAGFIGSHLAERLLTTGANSVTVLDDLSTGQLANLSGCLDHDRFRFIHGSVLDELITDEAVRSHDVVIHLAAAVGVKLIMDQPLRSFLTNTQGTQLVLDAAYRHRRRFVLASTSEIYGKNYDTPLSEASDCVLGPPGVTRWAYATSKSVDEILATFHAREHGLETSIVRLFNTVGPRQSPTYGMVVPRLVQQAMRGEMLTVFGDGSQSRCFCHVTDVVRAFVMLLDAEPAPGEVFNVGSNEEVTISDLASRVIATTGSSSVIDLVPYTEAYGPGYEDMHRRVPDTTKIRDAFGWLPTKSLDNIITDVMLDMDIGLQAAFFA